MKKAIALKPNLPQPYSNGRHTPKARRLDEAEASHYQAISLNPDFAEAHSNLAVTLQEAGRLGEAEAAFKQAIALKPDYAEAYCNLGVTLKALGRLEEAEAGLRQAISLKSDYAEAHRYLTSLKKYDNEDEQFSKCWRFIVIKTHLKSSAVILTSAWQRHMKI